ncbi:HNH endonuclease [Calidifontibacillus erzurumensis]|uniref:HNH endonuclease n=1 Tax=Calidifontibacillus erzurumensis TaxID=2741433 RepID=UPI0035B55615
MGIFRFTGKKFGKGIGMVLGDSLKFVGKKLDNEFGDFVEEVGKGVKSASEFSFDLAGQALDGIWNTTSGLIHKDKYKQQKGFDDLKAAGSRTIKGVGQTLKSAGNDVSNIYHGVRSSDYDRALYGTRKLGEKVAVGAIAVGVLDIVDGIDNIDGAEPASAAETKNITIDKVDSAFSNELPSMIENRESSTFIDLKTPNEDYTGGLHHVSNVPLIEKEVLLQNGNVGVGTFPDFNEIYAVQLPEDMYLESDHTHFSYANGALKEAIYSDSSLASQFTNDQIKQILSGETPEGYTWHHHEDIGRLELVDTEAHKMTGHLGGRELWGGGKDFR